MKKLTILLILSVFFSGCATVKGIQSTNLPENYQTDIYIALDKINSLYPTTIKNKYEIKILPTTVFRNKNIPLFPPYIIGTVIYIDEGYLKFFHYYQKRCPKGKWVSLNNYICLFAHEVAHTESGLGSSPLATHIQVDRIAINYCQNFGITKKDYALFLFMVSNYADARSKTTTGCILDFFNFSQAIISSSMIGVGFVAPHTESDASQRWLTLIMEK